MTTQIDGDTFVHQDDQSPYGLGGYPRKSTFRHLPGGSVHVTCGTGPDHTTDLMTYAERVALARFLLRDVAWGPKQTMRSFVAGISGGNAKADRLAYVESFGDQDPAFATDLRTWVNHEDSQNLTGVWDERVKSYYAARGY